MKYLYSINNRQDFIRVFSTELTSREVEIWFEKGKWGISHFSHNTEDITAVRIYNDLITHCCNIAEDLNSDNPELREISLMQIMRLSDECKGTVIK